jgi:hypothetical protein
MFLFLKLKREYMLYHKQTKKLENIQVSSEPRSSLPFPSGLLQPGASAVAWLSSVCSCPLAADGTSHIRRQAVLVLFPCQWDKAILFLGLSQTKIMDR